MKSILRTILVLALTVFASASYAQGVETYIKAKGEKTFSVHHNITGKFQFIIKDESGRVVYAINGSKNARFLRTFDVKNLPAGHYTLEGKDTDVLSIYNLQITSNGLNINKEQALTASR